MHVNHEYMLATAAALAPTGRILDYGCGDGSVVEAGLTKGLDIWGAEMFYGGAHGRRETVAAEGLLGSRIREIEPSGRIPFDDTAFDVIVNNQVLEHVTDLRAVLKELRRVLRAGGTLVSMFPSREVWREGHCGVPFAHRFAANSRVGNVYVFALRSLGLGYHHANKTRWQWAIEFREWLATYTVYRPQAEIHQIFGEEFEFEHVEGDYIEFRLRNRGRSRMAEVTKRFRPLAEPTFRRLGFMVITARARTDPIPRLDGIPQRRLSRPT